MELINHLHYFTSSTCFSTSTPQGTLGCFHLHSNYDSNVTIFVEFQSAQYAGILQNSLPGKPTRPAVAVWEHQSGAIRGCAGSQLCKLWYPFGPSFTHYHEIHRSH
jgi:hypothetical protein